MYSLRQQMNAVQAVLQNMLIPPTKCMYTRWKQFNRRKNSSGLNLCIGEPGKILTEAGCNICYQNLDILQAVNTSVPEMITQCHCTRLCVYITSDSGNMLQSQLSIKYKKTQVGIYLFHIADLRISKVFVHVLISNQSTAW